MDDVICPGCGISHAAEAKFCPYCGMAFALASEPDETITQTDTDATKDATEFISEPLPTDRPIRIREHDARRIVSRFRWWHFLILALVIGVIIVYLNSSRPDIITDFKDAKAATGWQFTAYSPQSQARSNNGLAIYHGIYIYKDGYPNVTVTINAVIRNDAAMEQNGYLCIWLRYNPGLRKGYCFIVKPEAKTAHLGIAGDPNPQSVDMNQIIPNFNPYQAHTYTASASNEYLRFAIDGKQVASLYDVGLIKGQVALEARGLGATITRAEIVPGN